MTIPPKRQGRYTPQPAVFVLGIGKRPILAFEAISNREAQELAKEQWLLEDLKRLQSDGAPLWDGEAKLQVGAAVGAPAAEMRASLRAAAKESELAIVYLVPLDSA